MLSSRFWTFSAIRFNATVCLLGVCSEVVSGFRCWNRALWSAGPTLSARLIASWPPAQPHGIEPAMNELAAPANAGFMSINDALVHVERCRAENRLIEAEAVCRRVLEAQPDLAIAEHLLGLIAHQNGRLGDAIEHVQKAIRMAPRVALFHANLGEMLRLAGRPKLAAESARRAIEIEPNMAMALSNLGVALYELKDYKEAARVHRKAIAADPKFA